MLPPVRPQVRRSGCLTGFWKVGIVLVVAVGLMMAAQAIFEPWAFYLGGRFHITPYWQGWGKLHAKSGDYLLLVRIQPDSLEEGESIGTSLSGFAYICTPRGERLPLHLNGNMRRGLNRSTDGEAVNLSMYYGPWYEIAWYGTTEDHSPNLSFRGYWRNPNLVMDDQGSIALAFQPDGSVYHGHGRRASHSQEIVPITFQPRSRSDFDATCAALQPE